MYKLVDILDNANHMPVYAKEIGQSVKGFTAEVGEQLVIHFADGKHLRYPIVESVEEDDYGFWILTQFFDINIEYTGKKKFSKSVDF